MIYRVLDWELERLSAGVEVCTTHSESQPHHWEQGPGVWKQNKFMTGAWR